MKKFYIITMMFIGLAISSFAQGNVGIGTNSPDASSKLDVTATDKGLLIPRVALTATNAADPISSPATSLLVYNTATAGTAPNNVTPGYYYNAGTPASPNWVRIDIKANNGLTKNGDYIQLGGALIQPTTVSGLTATNKMSFTGTGVDAFNVDGTTFSVDATNDRVGIGTNAPKEKLQVAGNILADNNIIATKGIVSGKIEKKQGPGTGADNQFHTVLLSPNYGATGISVYATSDYLDGDIKIIGTDISPLLSTTDTAWYYTDAGNNTHVWKSLTASNVYNNNSIGSGCDNCSQRVYCPDGYIVTGWEAHASTNLEHRLHIRCTQLASGYTTVETNEGIESVLCYPNANVNNITHTATCPAGTFIKGISIYTGSYYEGPLQVNCTGIKKAP